MRIKQFQSTLLIAGLIGITQVNAELPAPKKGNEQPAVKTNPLPPIKADSPSPIEEALPSPVATDSPPPVEATLPPPYDTVALRPFNGHGFYNNTGQMSRLFAQYKPKVVVEVGCWMGASTMHMASMLPKDGKLYAVDHWLGSEEHQDGGAAWSPHLPYIYEQFLSNIIHTQFTHIVVPMRMTSLEASKKLTDLSADFIFIDASHDFDSVYADLTAWFPKVKGHGLLCGDDWGYPPICEAVMQFAEENNLDVEAPGDYMWVLHERN